MITPHTSCKYAVVQHAVSGDYLIAAVHALSPGTSASLLLSVQRQAHDDAHVWGTPKWVSEQHVIALCQTSEAAAKYRRWLREQDRETEQANVH